MALELCILASGSAGNAAILRTPAGVLLIDAGIGPRTLANRLEGTGVRPTDIAALCLTHLDGDHFSPRLASTILQLGIPIYCHANKVDDLARFFPDLAPFIQSFDAASFSPIEGLRCDPIHFAHDRLGSHGFVVDGFGYRIGYATDLGRVPRYFFDRFHDLDCVALESNYDPHAGQQRPPPVLEAPHHGRPRPPFQPPGPRRHSKTSRPRIPTPGPHRIAASQPGM
jgi:phosphoribosyl 1,2-cyclic phosphodiesterase